MRELSRSDDEASEQRKGFSLRRIGKIAEGPRPARHGAAAALALATGAVVAWTTWDQYLPGAGGATATYAVSNVLLALAIAGLFTGVLFATAGRRWALPWTYLWVLVSCLILLGTLGGTVSPTAWYATAAVIAVGASLLGGALGAMSPFSGRPTGGLRHFAALATAIVLLSAPALWLVTATQGAPAAANQGPAPSPVAEDPAAPGTYETATLTYGSGTGDRAEYAASADLETPAVDASAIVGGWDSARESMWGFGSDAFPVNGRVWYPEGDGPLPLVLIAHGNKSNATASEDGYEYLGQHLAGQGFVTVAVDQNFLNPGPLDRSGGLSGTDLARGWLLLEHLRVWNEWNQDETNPFGGRIDMGNVGLIGHSRGGEAISVAAYLAEHGSIPGDTATEIDLGDGVAIRSLLALAPSDGRYLPDDAPIRLRDVNYLALQGSHDADISSFSGLDQYERIDFTGEEPNVKSALYIGRADHSHFNTRWGSHDVGNGLPKHYLDTEALIPADDQRRIAQVYASSFLLATLAGETELLEVLRDHRTAEPYLPEAEYVNQYASSNTSYADDAALNASGDAEAETQPLPLRGGPGDDEVLALTWDDRAEDPAVTAEMDPAAPDGGIGRLVFDAVAMTEDADSTPEVTVRLTDAAGQAAELPLTDFMPMQSLVNGQYLKAAWMHPAAVTEPILQTYTLPLDAFAEAEPDFDPTTVDTVTLEFSADTSTTVLLDDLGLLPPEA